MSHTLIKESPVEPTRPGLAKPTGAGLKVPRRYTRAGIDPLDQVKWDRRRTVISNPDGSVVFRMDDVEVPAEWSQLATDIVVSKYFRKAGLKDAPGHETSVRQVVRRLAHTIRVTGEEQGGYFASREDADAFEAELAFMLVRQIGAFNSPVWFNCGLYHEYGIGGSGGNYYTDLRTDAVRVTDDSYSHPQVSACFIQSVDDDLMSIFELAKNEARVFKFGSGTGTNFSRLRGRMEKLSGGGTSSGLMSFLEVLDKGAGATKSGEQLILEETAEAIHGVAHRRLGHGEPLRRAGEAAFFVSGFEDRKQVQIDTSQIEHGAYHICNVFSSVNIIRHLR